MSEMETKTVKETVEDIKSAIDTDIKSNIDRYNNAVETQKQFIKDTKEEINARKEEFKNRTDCSFRTSGLGCRTRRSKAVDGLLYTSLDVGCDFILYGFR